MQMLGWTRQGCKLQLPDVQLRVNFQGLISSRLKAHYRLFNMFNLLSEPQVTGFLQGMGGLCYLLPSLHSRILIDRLID
jgi:hypothetical protein